MDDVSPGQLDQSSYVGAVHLSTGVVATVRLLYHVRGRKTGPWKAGWRAKGQGAQHLSRDLGE